MSIPPQIARFVYTAYTGFFVFTGVSSMFLAHLEWSLWFGVTVSPELGGTNLLDQYRFLRAVEAGFGLLALSVRDDFFADTPVRRAILAAFLMIPVSRTVGILVDGVPGPEFIGLVAVEYTLWGFLVAAGRGQDTGSAEM